MENIPPQSLSAQPDKKPKNLFKKVVIILAIIIVGLALFARITKINPLYVLCEAVNITQSSDQFGGYCIVGGWEIWPEIGVTHR